MSDQHPKKKSLHDLSREMPNTEQLEKLLRDVETMDPKACALILSAFVDSLLETAISFSFIPLSKEPYENVFRRNGAPIGSFSSKILLGWALGIYDAEARSQLDRFRQIRNAFAHSVIPMDFDNPTVAEECAKLDVARVISLRYVGGDPSSRGRFQEFGMWASSHILGYMTAKASEARLRGRVGPVPWRGKFQ